MTTRVSVTHSGAQASGSSAVISRDGRYEAFTSSAANVVPADTNGHIDVFLRDRTSGAITRVSVNGAGGQADGESGDPALSADGRFIAFSSSATNLVAGDTNGVVDVFVRDVRMGTTTRASVSSTGEQANADIGHGVAAGMSPSLSADGRYVAFVSPASNLVPHDTDGFEDVFVRDLVAGSTTRANVTSAEREADFWAFAPSLSADGRLVAFGSAATNLVPSDTNGQRDVFVRDLEKGTTERVSLTDAGEQRDDGGAGPFISGDGRYVAFLSALSTGGPAQVFIRDRQGGHTELVSQSSSGAVANNDMTPAGISADGRYVSFYGKDSNLVPDDTNNSFDVFVRDRQLGETERVSVATDGRQGDSDSSGGTLSDDGRFVGYGSEASNLVLGDTNRAQDAFVRDRRAVPPPTPHGDFDHDGWADLITRRTTTGALFMYGGSASGLMSGRLIGANWNGMNAITRLGDFDGDGHEDLVAREQSTGALWLYRGNGTGFASRIRIGLSGWNSMREITAIGDLTRDGRPDLLAVHAETGELFLYPGRDNALGARLRIGTGWNAMSELAGVGDFTGDGHVDLIARHHATGNLYLYRGRSSGVQASTRIGTGWSLMRDLVGAGDLDRDGHTDLVAVHRHLNNLYWYPGNGAGLRGPLLVGYGWTSTFTPIL